MTRETRLRRLEDAADGGSSIILAIVPEHWDEEEVSAGVARLRHAFALSADWDVDLNRERTCTKERLLFAGNLDALFKEVAQRSRRIGVEEAPQSFAGLKGVVR